MKVLRFSDCAFLVKSIDAVNWHRIRKDRDKAIVCVCSRQLVRSEEFDTDEEAERYFNKIIKKMEKCND